MSEFERLNQLLADIEAASVVAAHRIRVERCRKEFASIRVDTHAIAHEICDARESYRTIVVECAEEGKRLGAWGAAIRAKNAEMEALKLKLVLSDPTVKVLWEQATAILKHEAESYMIASEKREAHKTYGEKMINQAYIAMRIGRADIIERVVDLRLWLHSEEEISRRTAIKETEKAKALKRIEGREILDFADALEDFCGRIAVKMGQIMELSTPIMAEKERKTAFATKMQKAKKTKKAKLAAEEAERLARQVAEEAELQRLIEEEAAAKLAAENKVKVDFYLTMAEGSDDLDDIKSYIIAAKELDNNVPAMTLINNAAARLSAKTIVVEKAAAKKIEVCHVKPLKLHAKERRELAHQGVRGKDWSAVVMEA